MIKSGKSYSNWLARFNRKMSFHFPWVVPLISDQSVWHNGKQPGTRSDFSWFPDLWECWRRKRSIDDWCNKREYDRQAVFNDLSWHFINPRSLIRRHCIYNVPDVFTSNRMKYKLLRYVGKLLEVKMLLFKSNLFSLAKDSILELVDFPTTAKKWLKVYATILSSLL